VLTRHVPEGWKEEVNRYWFRVNIVRFGIVAGLLMLWIKGASKHIALTESFFRFEFYLTFRYQTASNCVRLVAWVVIDNGPIRIILFIFSC
jgi:hypothetical protein